MLLGVSGHSVARPDPRWAPPDHVLCPCPAKLFLQWQAQLPLPQIGDHRFDGCERLDALSLGLGVKQQAVMANGTGLHQMRGGLRWEGLKPAHRTAP